MDAHLQVLNLVAREYGCPACVAGGKMDGL